MRVYNVFYPKRDIYLAIAQVAQIGNYTCKFSHLLKVALIDLQFAYMPGYYNSYTTYFECPVKLKGEHNYEYWTRVLEDVEFERDCLCH